VSRRKQFSRTSHRNRQVKEFIPACPACGKWAYPTRRHARQAAARKFPGELIRAYQCGPWWHITSQLTKVVTYWRDQAAGKEIADDCQP
jgi:hypothetical protein